MSAEGPVPDLVLDRERFLGDLWQRRPALLRAALPGYRSPLTPSDLASLACEDGVESRLVHEREGPWRVEHGPFDAERFAALPGEGWSLLVHGVDRLLPEIAALLDRFRFVPNWRLDDVMVSHAPPGGSVGAHVDAYDVFLVQAAGRRRWAWTDRPTADPAFVPDRDVRLLARFEPDREAILGPGDVLYLPPGVAHHGVALEDCVTCSVGFRAPSRVDLAGGLVEALVARDDDVRYADPGGTPVDRPGAIDDAAVERARALLRAAVLDDALVADALGRVGTAPTRPLPDPDDPEDVVAAIARGETLARVAPSCLAFVPSAAGGGTLYAAGEPRRYDPDDEDLVDLVTGTAPLRAARLAACLGDPPRASGISLLRALASAGLLATDDDPAT